MSEHKVTPLMQQYFATKVQYPDTLLLFQVGDFFELFFDDARTAAYELGITLTRRGKHHGQDIPLCGIPCHNLGFHLTKLVRAGFKVAVCEQVEKGATGGLMTRKVTKFFTPGTLTDQGMLQDKKPSYLCALGVAGESYGLLFLEMLTFQAFATSLPIDQMRLLENEFIRFLPDEVVVEKHDKNSALNSFFAARGLPVSLVPSVNMNGHSQPKNDAEDLALWHEESLQRWFDKQFNRQVAEKLQHRPAVARSVGSLARFLWQHHRSALDQVHDISFYEPDDFLVLDAATQHNLELLESTQGAKQHGLFNILDKAQTAMGARTLKKWLLKPLVTQSIIEQRLDLIELLVNRLAVQMQLQDLLSQISDLERIVGRIALDRALVEDFLLLKDALKLLPQVKQALIVARGGVLGARIFDQLHLFPELYELLEVAINTELGADKSPIKNGFDAELDRLRDLVYGSQQKILAMEMQEVTATGINSLKIREHEFYGYAIEVTKTNLGAVPAHYQLLQTLIGKNRYVTNDLKKLEHEIFAAREQIGTVEKQVFARVKAQVMDDILLLRSCVQALATLDAIVGLAHLAAQNNYCRPHFADKRELTINAGRHPIVEQMPQLRFIANGTQLSTHQPLWIVTGPNMGGKSTYLRQVALICIMAQMGSFVPAKSATLPILDRIFTRIGAGDNLAAGKSTFLVEMEEAATICRQATDKSLVILDEVGRGTSTVDGMAIAQAIIEYLSATIKPFCLFATHYHELTDLALHVPHIANYMLCYSQTPQGIVFLYELQPGCAKSSFGIEVAKLANLPASVIVRAQQLVNERVTHPTHTVVVRPSQTTEKHKKPAGDATQLKLL